ncbi:MAG TPA: DUF86 domain-containing protein [Nitrospirae bacterium]|nr:DUF86 domain-containing protein [Nitrospirota bacterium]HDZ88468.1 DUF86 domain-containing protein [Nitrospirota bacterium]
MIPPDFAYEFVPIASFRNFIAHDYEKIDYIKLCREALGRLDDITKYLNYIKKNQ